MDPEASTERLKASTKRLHEAVHWFAEPPLSLRSWGVRLLIAGMVCLLLVSIMALASSKQVLDALDRDRVVRTDRTCILLSKLDATPQEMRAAGCP